MHIEQSMSKLPYTKYDFCQKVLVSISRIHNYRCQMTDEGYRCQIKDTDARWRRSVVSTPAVPGSYLSRLRYSDEEKEKSFEYQCIPSEESQHYSTSKS
jgi:hypothetical protein